MNYTYVQLIKLTGKSVHTLRNVCHKLDIPRFLIKGVTHISQDGLETLEAHFSPKTLKNSRKKIAIIESYIKHQSLRSTGRSCNVSKPTVAKVVKEWEIDGCITVDSSMNFAEKIQNKGIFKKGRKFGYEVNINKVKYYKSGFNSEREAVDALYELKEKFS